ncbi:MAG: CrcB family protein [Sphingopyxis sp.]|nr:CrcB family protein [Sphingopyxis sp.]
MQSLFLVMAGGAIGAALRYGLSLWLAPAGTSWPWATLIANCAGGLAMGLLAGVLANRGLADSWRLLLGVGLLGGFTTFSAFSLEMMQMIAGGRALAAMGYTLASVVGSVLLLWAGLGIARAAA